MFRTRFARTLAASAFFIPAATLHQAPAEAQSRERAQTAAPDHGTISGPPVMAIVSIKEQRISLYDAQGGAMRARVSSGRNDYETPVGTYSVLEKNIEHYSNVYDDAAMPFMQRITWSGVALHQGELPGYPASHGCVRLPQSFAEQIFPLTKVGMRVIISRDNVAPVPMSHPLLFKPAPLPQTVAATRAAYEVTNGQQEGNSVFQPDLRNWPERQAELAALKAEYAKKSAEAEQLKPAVEDLKGVVTQYTAPQASAARAVRVAEKAKKAADDAATRAALALAAAKDPAKFKPFQAAKDKADAALTSATAKFTAATAAAEATSNERDSKRAGRAVRAADKAKVAAEKQVERAQRALTAAQSPQRYKKQEDALARADAAAKAAGAKHAAALANLEAADKDLNKAKQDLAAATAELNAAVTAAKEAKRKTLPVSMFVSLKAQRLYVRQAHEPVADFPISIADPGKPIGTHVFTAVDYEKGAASLRWTAVSLTHREDRKVAQLTPKGKTDAGAEPFPTDATAAAAALDRITIPQEVVARFTPSMWPGSSLIVSDEGLSKETNNATDFIVLISTEPQGGIKRRPKPVPVQQQYFDDGYSYYGSGYKAYGRPIRIQPKKSFFDWW